MKCVSLELITQNVMRTDTIIQYHSNATKGVIMNTVFKSNCDEYFNFTYFLLHWYTRKCQKMRNY